MEGVREGEKKEEREGERKEEWGIGGERERERGRVRGSRRDSPRIVYPTSTWLSSFAEVSPGIISIAVAIPVMVAFSTAALTSLIWLICWRKGKNRSYKSPVEVPSPSPTQPAREFTLFCSLI